MSLPHPLLSSPTSPSQARISRPVITPLQPSPAPYSPDEMVTFIVEDCPLHLALPARKASVTSLNTMISERDITARIIRLKALEESRQVSREFALYLPPSLSQAVKKSLKARRPHGRRRNPRAQDDLDIALSPHMHYMMPETLLGLPSSSTSDPAQSRREKKGKYKENAAPRSSGSPVSSLPNGQPQLMPKSWFLDVASPTWEDLRALGKLLHLHPLTLEDILQQDPREKLELFPKLGYYFISFRAIESHAVREKLQRGFRKNTADSNALEDEVPVGEANVYLTVFHDGICCFHFTDISEHTDQVRNRIARFEEVINMSSDWIAHGLLDSIVDSFFPFLDEIEQEVIAIEELVFTGVPEAVRPSNHIPAGVPSPPPSSTVLAEESENHSIEFEEKPFRKVKAEESIRPQFARPRPIIPLLFRHLKRFFIQQWLSVCGMMDAPPSSTALTLRRMARTRRLVTSLSRLLATKADVVAQIRKRLHDFDRIGLGNGTSKVNDLEIAMYMTDVHDHILTLQHSLAHYERMLSQSHPTYLSQLRTNFMTTRSGTDKALIYLTVVGISVLCIQTVIGLFSMNIKIPRNYIHGTKFHVFGIVISLAVMVLFVYLNVVRYWWKQAKRVRRAHAVL
ncbi:hypothetical protein BDQ17DRAFT_1340517 [Cyathus striatus]|nr:hypothetical protein BDQ17DRAFT_1340517 [Cyathus striatus]